MRLTLVLVATTLTAIGFYAMGEHDGSVTHITPKQKVELCAAIKASFDANRQTTYGSREIITLLREHDMDVRAEFESAVQEAESSNQDAADLYGKVCK